MVSMPASDTFRDHRVHAGGLCSASTEPTAKAHTANRKSSFDRDSLFVSIPSRTGDFRWPISFPAFLYNAMPGRLRPPPSHHGLRSPSQATSTRHSALGCRASREVLGQLSYLP